MQHPDSSAAAAAAAPEETTSSPPAQQKEEVTSPSVSASPLALANLNSLPPMKQLEPFLLDSVDNFMHLLPHIQDQLGEYLRMYPDQLKFVVDCFKPLLRDMRKRFMFHGRSRLPLQAPVCTKVPSSWVNCHGDTILDDYAWLTDRENPEVMKYLEQENQYAENSMSHTKTLQKVLYKEFVSRLDENEESARVVLSDGWSYFTRKIPGQEYRLHCTVCFDLSRQH